MVFHVHRHHCPDDSLLLRGNCGVDDSALFPIGLHHSGGYPHGYACECHRHLTGSRDAGIIRNAAGAAHDYQYADARSNRHCNEHGHTHAYAHSDDGYPYGDINLYAGTYQDFYTAANRHLYAVATHSHLYAGAHQHADTDD